MIGLRQIVNDLIQYQLEDYPDGDIQAKQAELNAEGVVRHSLTGVTEDHALQLLGDAPVLSGRPQQLGHELQYQLEDYPDEDIQAKQAELNAAYDAFYAKFGTIN